MSFGGFVGALGDAFMGQAQQDKLDAQRKFLYDQLNETMQGRRDIASENNASREERTNTFAQQRRDAATQGSLNRQAALQMEKYKIDNQNGQGVFPVRDTKGVMHVLNRSGQDSVTGLPVTSPLPGSGRAPMDPALRPLQVMLTQTTGAARLAQSRIGAIINEAKGTGIDLTQPPPDITNFSAFHRYSQYMNQLKKANEAYETHSANAQKYRDQLTDHVNGTVIGGLDTPPPEQPQQAPPVPVDPTQDASADPNFAAWMARQP